MYLVTRNNVVGDGVFCTNVCNALGEYRGCYRVVQGVSGNRRNFTVREYDEKNCRTKYLKAVRPKPGSEHCWMNLFSYTNNKKFGKFPYYHGRRIAQLPLPESMDDQNYVESVREKQIKCYNDFLCEIDETVVLMEYARSSCDSLDDTSKSKIQRCLEVIGKSKNMFEKIYRRIIHKCSDINDSGKAVLENKLTELTG